ncbi:TIMELESS-interacting protein isoform X1 [Mobula hypostoma]|uniref:TIMELESS-interacting protein isoform X1 n=1 Tax=Mobula hypostoma TaxID=723540 RepID=UPI002FC3CD34
MSDPLENGLFDIPDNEELEDEIFPPLPPPTSPGQPGYGEGFADGEDEARQEGTQSKEPVVLRKSVRRPQPKLDAQRLTSDRGLPALRNLFDGVRFKGKGHEVSQGNRQPPCWNSLKNQLPMLKNEDVKTLLWHMEHWAHRLYPKLQFEEFVAKVEALGGKKEVQTCLKKIRLDIPLTTEDFTSNEAVENEDVLQVDNSETSFNEMPSQPVSTSTPCPSTLSEEQRLRIERNKQLALEKRQARLQLANQTPSNDHGDSQCSSQPMMANGNKMVFDPDTFEDENVKTITVPSEQLSESQLPTEVTLVETPKDSEEMNKTIDSIEPADNSEATEGTCPILIPETAPEVKKVNMETEISCSGAGNLYNV